MSDPRLSIGGNNPPDPIKAKLEALREMLDGDNGDLDIRIEELEAAAARGAAITIENEETAEAFTEQLGDINRAIKESNFRFEKAKAPFLALAGLVDNFFAIRKSRLIAARDLLAPKLAAWQDFKGRRDKAAKDAEAERQRRLEAELKKEREAKEAAERKAAEEARRAQEEAARKAREAEEAQRRAKAAKDTKAAENARKADEAARLAAQKAEAAQQIAADTNRAARVARQQTVQQETITQHVVRQAEKAGGKDATRVRGMYGAKAVLRETWDFEIEDPTKVPRAYCSPDPVKIRAAINGESPVKRISGVRIFEKKTTQVRS